MKIEIEDSLYDKLLALSKEINNQDHRCTAMPYLFQIQEEFRIWDTGLNGDTFVFLTQDFEAEYEVNEKGIKEYCEYHDIDVPGNAADMDIYDSWFKTQGLTISSYSISHKYSNAFFTANGCKSHIRLNGYHYNNPRDFLNHAFRNPEMELVFKFLCSLDGSNIHT